MLGEPALVLLGLDIEQVWDFRKLAKTSAEDCRLLAVGVSEPSLLNSPSVSCVSLARARANEGEVSRPFVRDVNAKPSSMAMAEGDANDEVVEHALVVSVSDGEG